MAISSTSMRRTAKLYALNKRIEDLESSKSRGIKPGEQAERAKLLKEAKKERDKLQRRLRLNVQFLLGTLLVGTIALAIIKAWLEPETHSFGEALSWLFKSIPATQKEGGEADFYTVLAPLLAISVAIERLLETAFNWFEQSLRAVADVLVAPKETLDWIGREYQDAYKTTEEAAEIVQVEMTPENLELLKITEDRLAKAEERLRGWVNAPEYLAWKRALSIWFGLLAGLVISVLGDLGMFSYIGIPAPRLVDMVVTGLVIGSGPGPMHDLIGILQSGKDALGSLTELAKGKTVQEAVEAIQKAKAMQKGQNG
jgi:hypothetical protein